MPLPLDQEDIAPRECELIRRVAQQDSSALAELYELTVSRIYAVVMRVLRHAADAEEVTSDVYLQVWDKACSFQAERGSVITWMNTMAWSRAVDKLRKTKREHGHREVHPEEIETTYADCDALNVESIAESWSDGKRVRKALQELSDMQQKVLQLAYARDLSHQDIAEVLGLPLGTVKSHCRRGLAALREVLPQRE